MYRQQWTGECSTVLFCFFKNVSSCSWTPEAIKEDKGKSKLMWNGKYSPAARTVEFLGWASSKSLAWNVSNRRWLNWGLSWKDRNLPNAALYSNVAFLFERKTSEMVVLTFKIIEAMCAQYREVAKF